MIHWYPARNERKSLCGDAVLGGENKGSCYTEEVTCGGCQSLLQPILADAPPSTVPAHTHEDD